MLKDAASDLRRSGITIEEAETAEMFSTKDASEYCADFRSVPALVIPYVDPWTDEYVQYKNNFGEYVDFMRVRYLDKPSPKRGFTNKKQIRYSQPKHSGVHAYFPIVENFEWERDVFDNIEQLIVFTEGEKKATAGSLMGAPTVGLGGVHNFIEKSVFLPELDQIEFEGRKVIICYDSDARTNGQVRLAQDRLAVELSTRRGASVFVIRLPDDSDGNKQGLDDYIVNEGEAAFDDLIDSAMPIHNMDKAVMEMNERVAYIEDEGHLVDMETGMIIKKESFKEGSKYSAVSITTLDANGKVKVISVAKAWLKHPNARRYSTVLFRPDTVMQTVDDGKGGIALNGFRPLIGVPGDTSHFWLVVDYLVSLTPELDPDLIFKMLCWKVQNLHKRLSLGLMFLGPPGSGKTFVMNVINQMFAPYSAEISSKDLGSEFNPWVENSLCVTVNEAEAKELKFNMATLKGLITDKMKSCNEKYRTRKQVINYAMYGFTSNQLNAGSFEDDDRRMLVYKCPPKHPGGDKFYGPKFAAFESGALALAVLYQCQNYDLKGWTPPTIAPVTRAKRNAYHGSLTPLQEVANDIKKSDTHIVEMWVGSALSWAHRILSTDAHSSASEMSTAQDINTSLATITIRPFYEPSELIKIFAPMAENYAYGRVRNLTSAQLAEGLQQEGIEYLKCSDCLDGFYYRGKRRQYLIVSDHEDFVDPISDEEFTYMMDNEFLSYAKTVKARKNARIKAAHDQKRTSKRNKRT